MLMSVDWPHRREHEAPSRQQPEEHVALARAVMDQAET
jgi:hypothetical protein